MRTTALWAALAVALGAALVAWPYQKACGLQLFFFLGAAGVTLIVGGLGAINSWAWAASISPRPPTR